MNGHKSKQHGFLLNPFRFNSGGGAFDVTKLLLNGDGVDNSTVFTDSSIFARTLTASGGAKLSAANAKFGNAAMDFTLAGSSIINDLLAGVMAFGTQDFCTEFWMKRSSITPDGMPLTTTSTADGSGGWWINFQGDNINVVNDATSILAVNAVGSATGVYIHWALSRQGSTFRLFKNGVLIMSNTSTTIFTASIFRIGGVSAGGFPSWIQGYIDDLRIVVGIPVYTANFTPPTQALPQISGDPYFANVDVLIPMMGSVQETARGLPVTIVSTSGSPTINANSITFTPSQYLRVDGLTPLGTGDFTIESFSSQLRQLAVDPGTYQISTAVSGLQPSYSGAISVGTSDNPVNSEFANGGSGQSIYTAFATGIRHLCVQRTSGVLQFYVNGVLRGSQNDTNNYQGTVLAINGYYSTVYLGEATWQGFRLTRGVARYSANFTPQRF